MKTLPSLCLGALLLAEAHADVISWNYDRYGTVSAERVAGIEPVANWNNSWPSDPRTDLIDDEGNPTTLDIAYTSFNNYSVNGNTGPNPGQDADGTYNRELLNGYLNAGPAAWNPPTTSTSVTLSQIPYANYDVIVYFSADVAGREGDVTDGVTTYSFNTIGLPSVSGTNAVLTPTTDTEGTYTTAANYARFSGLSGATQTITVQMRDNDEWGGIAGFQIVANLGVLPEFGSQPEDTSAAVDGTAEFSAGVAADPAPTFQWEFSADGVNDWEELPGETFTTLELFAVQFSDEGFYRLIATNDNGSVASDPAHLDVFYATPEFFEQPANTYAVEGSTVELTADAFTYGNPGYQWYKDGEILPGETSATLTLVGVGADDEGEYFLRVTDDVEPDLFGDSDTVNVFTYQAWDGLVSHDPFDTSAGYVLGELPLQEPAIAGYDGPWTDVDFGDAEPQVMESSLVYPDPLYLGSSGDRVGKSADVEGIAVSTSGRVYRKLAPELVVAENTSGVRYLSWLYRHGNEGTADAPTVHSVLSLYQDTGGVAPAGDAALRTFEAGISDADFGTTNFAFRYNDSQVGDLGVPVDSDVHLFVVKLDLSDEFAADTVTVWLDPQLGGEGDPAGGVSLEFLDVAFDSLAFSDYASNSMAWDEVRWGSTFDSVTLNPNPPDNFAAWIQSYPGVGEMDGFDEDPDGDGLENGVENYFGTHPGEPNAGVTEVARSGNTVTFQHPLNAIPASDVTAAYEWSLDLAAWHADGAAAGGATVDFEVVQGSGIATVTATISGTVPSKLFTRVAVAQAGP